MSIPAKGGAVERIHGIEVRDPYRWLEDRQLPETCDWLSRQQRSCDQYFSQSRNYDVFKKIVQRTLSVNIIDQAARVGKYLFFRKQAKEEERPAIWIRAGGGDATDRLLVNPAEVGSSVTVDILRISSDGSMLAYSVRSSGSDAMEIRIVDVEQCITLTDRLPLSYVRGFEFDVDGTGFYYCIEPIQGTSPLAIKHHLYRETSSSDDSLFSVPWSEHRRLVLAANGRTLAALVTEPDGATMVQDLFVSSEVETAPWRALYTGMRKRMWPLFAKGRVFLLDRTDALNGRIVEVREDGEPYRVIVPEGLNVLQSCSVLQGDLLLTYLADSRTRIERWSVDGEFQASISLPPGGSIEVLPSVSEYSSSFFFLRESYTEAPSLWEVDLTDEHNLEPVQWTASDDRSSAVVHERWYTSRDGTRIPVVLLEPADKRCLGPQPVVLTGYGGFGVAEVPRFSRLAKIMVELGATMVRPSIRGGSEFGDEWHRAATKKMRQLAIDDFLAAAEWLCSEHITDERHLAIMGNSNGGLLVAATVIQRPGLFKAVLCTGPLTDMVRYELFDHAFRWRAEYGTVEDAEEFMALLSYSPYHNVVDSLDYPAMLFVTGDADDRCNPAHVRKMAAALQDRAAQHNPIIVDHARHWGHVPTLSLSERVETLTRKVAFLCEQLDIAIPGGFTDDISSS